MSAAVPETASELSFPVAPGAPAPPRIKNRQELLDHGMSALRGDVLRIAEAGIAACDAERATLAAVQVAGDRLRVADTEYPLSARTRIIVVGSGKASVPIARALERRLGERIQGSAVVARDGAEERAGRIEVIVSDHPLPTERSLDAARRLLALAEAAGEDDIVFACFTGGSSALTSMPPHGVTIEEKRRLHELLLSSGMGIVEVNVVRKHVSLFKGGRLGRAVAPAALVNLTISDVAGDPLDAITDPTVADSSSADDAIAILRGYGLWEEVPPSVRLHLQGDGASCPALDGLRIQTVVLANGESACRAMTLEATAAGLRSVVLSTSLEGEARELGSMVANLARESCVRGAPFEPPVVLLGCGGEATVTLGRSPAFGEGGPNQEAALAAARVVDGSPIAAAFLDTDGSDGGTERAGAVIDGLTVARAGELGVDLRTAVLEHRAKQAFESLGDGVLTGPTGTNVNDLFVVAAGDGRSER